MEDALPNKFSQARIKGQLEAKEEGVHGGCKIHSSDGRLESFLGKEVGGQKQENNILGNVFD